MKALRTTFLITLLGVALTASTAMAGTFAQTVQTTSNVEVTVLNTSGTVTVSATGQDNFSYLVAGTPFGLGTPVLANFLLTGTSTQLGACGGVGCINGDSFTEQGFTGNFSYTVAGGAFAGQNLLSGTYTVNADPTNSGGKYSNSIGGTGGSFAASQTTLNPGGMMLTSSFLNFRIAACASARSPSPIPNPQKVSGLHHRHGLLQRARVGQPDVFDGHAHQAARDVQAVLAGLQHARQPVERGIGIARPHGFVQRRDQVVVLFARFVVEQHLALDGVLHGRFGKFVRRRSGYGGFQRVVGGARIAAGVDGDLLQQGGRRGDFQFAQTAFAIGQSALQQLHDLLGRERAQRIHTRARQQRRNHFERRVLRSGADQDDIAALDIREKCVLLRLVEAVRSAAR